jgi:hypothetical protein
MIRCALIATLALSGPAWGAEYRSITLSNGRVVPAEIKSITANEMVLQTIGESTLSALTSCGTDLQCATRHGETARADVVIMGQVGVSPDNRVLTLGAIFVDAPAARRRVEVPYTGTLVNHRKAITHALYDTLFLTPPTGASVPKIPVIATKPAPRKKGEADLATLAWMPVPGLTALKQDNTVGFATALGVVGAGTAATVYMTGAATYSAPQLIAVSTLSSYGLTVLVNHLFLD